MKISNIHHIGIAVKDIKKSVERWKKIFDLNDPCFEEISERGVSVAEFEFEEGPSLELISPLGENKSLAGFLEKKGEGIHHFCFEVDDINEVVVSLRKAGAQFVNEKPQKGAGGSLIVFIHPRTVNGVLIELKQKPKE
ncbi:MAG: methylmalonyl-CoA epimerase [Candidatus Aminicenantes bacterium]|nr:methylmalonyl-CoA epimerase [Candidatus Aminicenantes bacterium]